MDVASIAVDDADGVAGTMPTHFGTRCTRDVHPAWCTPSASQPVPGATWGACRSHGLAGLSATASTHHPCPSFLRMHSAQKMQIRILLLCLRQRRLQRSMELSGSLRHASGSPVPARCSVRCLTGHGRTNTVRNVSCVCTRASMASAHGASGAALAHASRTAGRRSGSAQGGRGHRGIGIIHSHCRPCSGGRAPSGARLARRMRR
jgi:hypothetical protein